MTPAKSRTLGMLTVCLAVAAIIGTVSADWVTTTIATGTSPYAVAVNPVTNRVYIANQSSSNVTVIDGATNATTTVPAGSSP
jgi:YVTN family beta-propeller protein